jgi:hypothetical protein
VQTSASRPSDSYGKPFHFLSPWKDILWRFIGWIPWGDTRHKNNLPFLFRAGGVYMHSFVLAAY